jgi:hypothetical protein
MLVSALKTNATSCPPVPVRVVRVALALVLVILVLDLVPVSVDLVVIFVYLSVLLKPITVVASSQALSEHRSPTQV